MKVYAVTSNNHRALTDDYRNAWAYSEFFHGTKGPVVNRYGERPYRPLPLIRNVRLMPALFFPTISMVVDNGLAERLQQIKGVELNPCRWEKVYDYPVDEEHVRELLSRFSVLTEDFSEWLERMMHPPDAAVSGVRYFEVLAPPLSDVAREFFPTQEFKLPSPFYMELEPFRTCALLHEQNPIARFTPYYLCTETVYEIVAPHVDSCLFRVYPLEVN